MISLFFGEYYTAVGRRFHLGFSAISKEVPGNVGYRIESFDRPKYRTLDIWYRPRFTLRPLYPRVFYADTERKLRCIEYRNRSIDKFFVCRYRIELDSNIDIQH